MSAAVTCDQCGETLVVNDRGDDEMGERAGWLRVSTNDGHFKADLCTRACVVAWLDDPDVAAGFDAYAQTIAEIAAIIRSGRDDEDESGTDEGRA